MALTTTEHAAVQRRTKDARSSAATIRRAANRQRVSGAVVLQATDQAGNSYTLVMCTKEPGKAYLLTRDRKSGAWLCGCFRARWRQTCDHLEAIRLQDAAAVPDA